MRLRIADRAPPVWQVCDTAVAVALAVAFAPPR
jgi:hypothetical protein